MPIDRRSLMLSMALAAPALALPARLHAAIAAASLRLSSFLPPNHIVAQQVLQPFAERVEQGTNGRLSIRLFHAGELANSSAEQLELVDIGVVDLALIVPTLRPGRFPEMSFVSLPDLIPNATVGSRLLTEMYFEGSRKSAVDFGNIVPIAFFATPPLFLHTRKSIDKLDAIAGMKVRVGSREAQTTLERLKATAVRLPSAEVLMALETGVVDGAAMSWDQYRALAAFEVLPFSLDINLGGSTPVLLAMGRKVFDGLADFERDAILEAGGLWLAERWGNAYDREAAPPEGRVSTLSDDDRERYAAIAAEIRQEWAGSGSFERQDALKRAESLVGEIERNPPNL